MEVHHHPHVGKKNLKEYILEGLMIFLAVTMGFIAENIRENIVKHEKEEALIESFILNLKADTAALNVHISRNLQKNIIFDSLLNLADKDLKNEGHLYNFYNYYIKGASMSLFIPSDAALTQIKTDGGLSIISKKGVIDSILNYDKQNKVIERHNGVYTDESENLWKVAYKTMEIKILKDTSYVDFFNGRIMKNKIPPSIINDPKELKIFFGTLTRVLLLTQVNRNHMKTHKEEAERLLHFLKETYHLE
jgi:hypothetical protein